MTPLLLLIASNIFMTIAWYGHLKFSHANLWIVILVSWGIALVEYCLAVPANRIGYAQGLSGGQLKIMQECVALIVFAVFAVVVLKEPLSWRYAGAFVCILGAAAFMFAGRTA
ncbi:DMT family protein [Sphingomonas flavalba]|uniref:DMT family protein n=1 Tax=Sphingomonas flavalba TaxID=2559804 RepID=UPI0039E1F90A